MGSTNIFDESFNQVSDAHQHIEDIRAKLVTGYSNLNEARKINSNRQKELTQTEAETSNLKKTNQDIKELLMKVLIEKEEFAHRKSALESIIQRLEQQIEEIETETELMILN